MYEKRERVGGGLGPASLCIVYDQCSPHLRHAPLPEEVVEWPYTAGAGFTPPRPPLSQTNVTIVGTGYRERLTSLFLVHCVSTSGKGATLRTKLEIHELPSREGGGGGFSAGPQHLRREQGGISGRRGEVFKNVPAVF